MGNDVFDLLVLFYSFLVMAPALKRTSSLNKIAHLVKYSEASKIRAKSILFFLTRSHNDFIFVKKDQVFEALLLIPGTSIKLLVKNLFRMFI
jgi:hypothetical protein